MHNFFLQSLKEGKRIHLASKHSIKFHKKLLVLAPLTILALSYFIIIGTTLEINLLLGYLALTVLTLILSLLAFRRFSAASFVGDTLILKSIFSSCSVVTSVNSVKTVQTRTLAGLSFTFVNYVLDGKQQRVIILGRRSDSTWTCEQFILKAKLWSKEKKANHKPGSVIA